nr:hypothetical protein [Mycoplasmopsis agalactiae]
MVLNQVLQVNQVEHSPGSGAKPGTSVNQVEHSTGIYFSHNWV